MANPVVYAQAPVITGPTNLFTLDTNEAFDPTLNNGEGAWTQKAKMPTPRSHLVACEVNHIIYAIGGHEGLASDASAELLATAIEAYDPATNTWATKTPMPVGRGSPMCGAIDGIIYVAGGFDQTTAPTATLYAFDPSGNGGTGSWTQKHDMPTARYGSGYAVTDGKFFIVGQGGGTVAYDPATDSWDASRADMPTPRGDLGVAVVNGILYAVAGGISNDFGDYSNVVEAYDPTTDQWTTNYTPLPRARANFGIGVFNNIIYAVGGAGFRHPIAYLFNDVEAFDPAANGGMGSWTQKTPMPTPRSDFSGVFVDGVFYAIGGTVLGTAIVGQPYIYQVTATNYPTSYTYDPPGVNNPFPDGLTLDPTSGLIYGVPTTAGKYRILLHATNASGTGNSVFDIGVFPAPAAGGLTVVSSTSATGRTAQAFSFQALVTGGSAATHFSFGNLPDGLNGNAVTGVISGTPTSDGNFVVAVTAIDGASETTGTLQLTFISDATVPIITHGSGVGGADSAAVVPGQFFSYTITADTNANFGIVPGTLPPGLSITSQTATTATISGIYGGVHILPDAIKKEPPAGVIQETATNSNGTGTSPLNLFEPGIASLEKLANGHVKLNFVGVPLKNHDLESTTNLVNYSYVTTLQADAGGHFSYEASTPGTFYRIRYPSDVNPNRASKKSSPKKTRAGHSPNR